MAVDFIGDGIALRSSGDILSSDGTAGYVLNKGTDGQILIARSSTVSGLQWETPDEGTAQKFIAISSTTISVAAVSVTISNIPQTYRDLLIIGTAKHSTGTSTNIATLNVSLNGDTGTTIDRAIVTALATSTTLSDSTVNGNSVLDVAVIPYNDTYRSVFQIYIRNYTTSAVSGWWQGGYIARQIAGAQKGRMSRGYFSVRSPNSKVPVTSLVFYPSSYGFPTQSFRIDMFGIKD